MRQSDWDDIIDSAIESDEVFESDLDPVQIATARIEQGNLYKLLIDNDIFEGVNASPDVLQKVRKEIVQFATMRLEILLGIRKVERRNTVASSSVSLDEEEVMLLKGLLGKVKGKEANAVSVAPNRTSTEPVKLKPIQSSSTAQFSNKTPPYSAAKKEPETPKTIAKPETHKTTISEESVDTTSELKEKKATISELKKERDIILKNVQKRDNEWTEEERRRFREISEAIDEFSRPKAHPNFYQPRPGINEENAISTARAELLSRNLGDILKRQ